MLFNLAVLTILADDQLEGTGVQGKLWEMVFTVVLPAFMNWNLSAECQEAMDPNPAHTTPI